VTVIDNELVQEGKTTNKSKPIWAIWATAAGSMLEREEEREDEGIPALNPRLIKGTGYVGDKPQVDFFRSMAPSISFPIVIPIFFDAAG
jgi:hypothetical protein